MNSKRCDFKGCEKEVESICRCISNGIYLCHGHLMIHMEEIYQNPHKVEFLYMRINDSDLEFILETIDLAKKKIDEELTKVIQASKTILETFHEKVDKELRKVMIMQQGLINALEKTARMTRINKNTDVPIFKSILKDFEKVKASLSNTDWFSLNVNEDKVIDAIDNFIEITFEHREIYKLTEITENFMPPYVREESKCSNEEYSSRYEEIDLFLLASKVGSIKEKDPR
ncbi:unnamed protein product [Blepharisma stoltei]|uniref:Uncharacterized protein n=1 Tax=Blepharisma stoltei TaxID=1481888 RepID=A0AAU9K0Y1_9CILI|nr:unnamed protein product [Blepharisma stoltei]